MGNQKGLNQVHDSCSFYENTSDFSHLLHEHKVLSPSFDAVASGITSELNHDPLIFGSLDHYLPSALILNICWYREWRDTRSIRLDLNQTQRVTAVAFFTSRQIQKKKSFIQKLWWLSTRERGWISLTQRPRTLVVSRTEQRWRAVKTKLDSEEKKKRFCTALF